MQQNNKLTKSHLLLMLITFCGWTISAMDASLFFFIAPYLMEYFDFDLHTFGIIVAVGFLIAIFFNMFTGPLMDYFGRKVIFQWVLVLMTLGTFLTGLAWSLASLIVFRLITTGSAFAEYAVGSTMLAETVPAKHRGWMIGIMAAGWPAGTALSALITLYVIPVLGWRSAFFLAALPAFIIMAIRLYIKEPLRYKDLAKVRRLSEKPAEAKDNTFTPKFRTNTKQINDFTYRQLFKGELLKNSVLIWLYMNLIVFAYGLLIWFGPYWMSDAYNLSLVNSTYIVFIGSIVNIFGFVTAGWLSSKLGVREVKTLFIIIGFIIAILITRFSYNLETFLPVYLLWNFFGAGIWGIVPRLFTEAFPTRVRGTGASINSASCWLGWAIISFLAPHIISANGHIEALFISGVILLPLSLIPLWLIRRIPPARELEDYIT